MGVEDGGVFSERMVALKRCCCIKDGEGDARTVVIDLDH